MIAHVVGTEPHAEAVGDATCTIWEPAFVVVLVVVLDVCLVVVECLVVVFVVDFVETDFVVVLLVVVWEVVLLLVASTVMATARRLHNKLLIFILKEVHRTSEGIQEFEEVTNKTYF